MWPADLGKSLPRLIALLLLFGLSLELTARFEDWVRYRTPVFSRYRSQGDLIVRDRTGSHGRPNSRFQKWQINNLGLRGPDLAVTKGRNSYRIATVGASETFGLYESPDREFPRQLEDSLNRMIRSREFCGSSIQRVDVLNASMPGMSLPTSIQDLSQRLRRYGLDAVIYYPSPPQYLNDRLPRADPPDSSGRGDEPPWSWAFYPRVAARLRDQIKLLIPERLATWLRKREVAAVVRAHGPGWRFDRIPPDRVSAFGHDLRALVGTVRSIGATPVLLTHANALSASRAPDRDLLHAWEKFYPRATGATILAFDSAAAEVTRTVAADSGVILVDWRAAVSSSPDGIFADYGHFTDRGAGLLAGTIARTLRQSMASQGTACTSYAGTGASHPVADSAR
jgi:hypothetical protein